ncbi:conserved hypothetical protein [Tenacibaculum maritimum]|uniref:hypothetical protein n=1 Tax=Tenacibaculum maritimum TaxID=107401 RepID=UPI0012E539A8|nr:hypothetical protein [Tenacibaculum maritimum]CAA0214130.1 conserved hypothetical protein [Tenacibaculum maritimum]
MYQPNFGTQNQIQFSNENEYYELLGYLAKSDGTTSLVWEDNQNQGAWGSEGRIKFYIENPPLTCVLNHTAGVGNVVTRVNCNEFVKNIVTKHNFVMGKAQNITNIKSTIPIQYIADFDRGLNL